MRYCRFAFVLLFGVAAITGMIATGSAYEYGERSPDNSRSVDGELMERAGAGDARAQYDVGIYFAYDAGDLAQAEPWLMQAARQGHTRAQHQLAELYYIGSDVGKNHGKMIRLYRLAAQTGLPIAAYSLATVYHFGVGVVRDSARALPWYQAAAEAGVPMAQYNLARMYQLGREVPHDYAMAAEWYRRASGQSIESALMCIGLFDGDEARRADTIVRRYRQEIGQTIALAMQNLGSLYAHGQGVPQDITLSFMWYSLAAAQGLDDATRWRDALAKIMTAEQIDRAETLARRWRPSHE